MNANGNGTTATEATEREAWLAARKNGVGASESAAAIGVSPWETPVELWQRKTGRAADTSENEAMRWGTLLEPLILAEYARTTGRHVHSQQTFVRHPVYPWMFCTLDAFTAGGRLVEVKTASAWARGWGLEGTDEVPDHYRVQVHHQMAVTGATEADLVVLVGGQRLQIHPIERDPGLVTAVEDRVGEFWECVRTDTPPTWGRLTAADLAAVFPRCEGEVEAPFELYALLSDHARAEADAAASLADVERLKARILELMGESRSARLADGRVVRRYRTEVTARDVTYAAKAHVKHYFRVLEPKGPR